MSSFRYELEYNEDTHAVSMSGGYDVRTSGLILSLLMTQWEDCVKQLKDGKTYHIELRPLNSRKQLANCIVELPHSVEEINKIIEVLTAFRDCISEDKDPECLDNLFSKEKEN